MSLPPKKPTRKLTPRAALADLKRAFRSELGIGSKTADELLVSAALYDKAYELSCLIETLRNLKSCGPSVSFQLIGGSKLKFRGKGGEIQRRVWPYINMGTSGGTLAEVWVDIECLALSASEQGKTAGNPPYGRAHELDVVVVAPGTAGRPAPSELRLGIEAKHRPFNKGLLKELLGIRRETAFKSGDHANPFAWWTPSGKLPAQPPSGIVLFCSHAGVLRFADPAAFWGFEMIHHPY